LSRHYVCRAMHRGVQNMHMHEFRPAKYGPQIQRVPPQYLGRADRGAHVSEQRVVVCCSKVVTLTPNRVAWPSRQCVAGNQMRAASNGLYGKSVLVAIAILSRCCNILLSIAPYMINEAIAGNIWGSQRYASYLILASTPYEIGRQDVASPSPHILTKNT
jgi:hypothetical protein